MSSSKFPSFAEEKKLWQKGLDLVIGVDEVGRGSWAGPVVAAAVAWPFNYVGAKVARQRFFRLPILPVNLASRETGQSRKVALPRETKFLRGRKGSTQKLGGFPAPYLSSVLTRVMFSLTSGQSPRTLMEFIEFIGINDSKALSSQKRVKLADIIKECSLWALGEIGVGTINRVGIGKATEMAMRKAVNSLWQMAYDKWSSESNYTLSAICNKPFVLVDAFHIRYLKGIGLKNQKAIVKGDQKSISIAAASILAKVYRDNLMWKLAKKYPRYGWRKSKGYGTKDHQKAILKYGLICLHRKQFVETFLRKQTRLRECCRPARIRTWKKGFGDPHDTVSSRA